MTDRTCEPQACNHQTTSRDRTPIWEDTGILLFGLLLIVLGGVGVIWGRTAIVLPSASGSNEASFIWPISGIGARVAGIGLLLIGTGLVGRWRWGQWTQWPVRCGVIGAGFVAVGLLVVGVAWLLCYLG